MAAAQVTTPPTRQAERAPKNIILIVLDDLGTDKLDFYNETPPTCPPVQCQPDPNCQALPTGCVGPYPATPNIDQLRRQGIWFTHAYATPVCSSSRACMQTGRFGMKTGIGWILSTTTQPGTFSLPDNEKLLAELLRDGITGQSLGLPYRSAAFGKWHMSTTNAYDYGHAVNNGYRRFYGTMGNVGSFYKYKRIEHDTGSSPVLIQVDGSNTVPPFAQDTWIGCVTRRDAVEWIRAQRNSFFAYVAFNPPHSPLQVPPLELVPTETSCALTCAGLAPGDILTASDPPELIKLVYRSLVEAVDGEIGKLIAGLRPAQRENTMIFVMGDNGTPALVVDAPHDPEHAKGTVYEFGIRVPLIVSGPLVKGPIPSEGWRSDALVSAVDLWQTIADITGADPSKVVNPNDLDSISFLPVLRNPTSAGNRVSAFSQIFSPNGPGPIPPPSCYDLHKRSQTDGTYKYIRTQLSVVPQPCGVPSYYEELFHLPTDPEEVTDLIHPGPLSTEAQTALDALRAHMDVTSGV